MDTARGDGGGGPADGDRYREYSMSPRETERSPAGRTTSPPGSGANRWWGRAVVACASLAALAGTVAAVATAAGADSEQAGRTEARDAADASGVPAPAPVPAADTAAAAPSLAPVPARPAPGPQRAGAPSLGATLAVPAGWQVAPGQDLVPVAPDRFPTVLTLADRATVLLGRLDPARGTGPDALADEARRLVGAFADGAMGRTPGERGRITDVSDAAGTLDGRDAHTVVRRVTTSDGPGPLVRVTTVAAGRGAPGLVLLAVAAAGPQQAADGTAAERVVRSLAAAPVPPGRAPAAGGRAGAPPPSATSAPRTPGPPASARPVSPPPARPTPTDR
jgi:hypothetical protein